MTVLLVDDEASLRRMVKLMLQTSGYDVIDAATYEDALELAGRQNVDLLLTDIVLDSGGLGPGDGFALAKAVAENKPDLPVIFMSGYPIELNCSRPLRCALLRKPFRKEDLLNILARLHMPI